VTQRTSVGDLRHFRCLVKLPNGDSQEGVDSRLPITRHCKAKISIACAGFVSDPLRISR